MIRPRVVIVPSVPQVGAEFPALGPGDGGLTFWLVRTLGKSVAKAVPRVRRA
jgi:hypothetical protein